MDNWVRILEACIGTGGLFMFIFGIYTMRVKKKSLEADLDSKYAEEWHKLYNELKEYTDNKVAHLEEKVDRFEKRDDFRRFAIEQYRHCPHLPKGGECPVIRMNEQIRSSSTFNAINEVEKKDLKESKQ